MEAEQLNNLSCARAAHARAFGFLGSGPLPISGINGLISSFLCTLGGFHALTRENLITGVGTPASVALPGDLVASCNIKEVVIWDRRDGHTVCTIPEPHFNYGFGDPKVGYVTAMTVLQGGILVLGYENGLIVAWDYRLGKKSVFENYPDQLEFLAWWFRGKPVSRSRYNAERVFPGHTSNVRSLVALPDGRLVSGSQDNTVRIWNVAVCCSNEGGAAFGECMLTIVNPTGFSLFSPLKVLPDGNLVSVSRDHVVHLWDVDVRCSNEGGAASGECLLKFPGHTSWVSDLAVLPGGKLASGSYDNTVRIWNVAVCCSNEGECLLTLAGHTGRVSALAVLPDGRLASGSQDNTVRIWDTASGECMLTLAGHTKAVTSLTVLPDGRLASGSYDHTIRVWDVNEGECMLTLAGHTKAVTSLTVLPKGRLASGSSDQTVRIWE